MYNWILQAKIDSWYKNYYTDEMSIYLMRICIKKIACNSFIHFTKWYRLKQYFEAFIIQNKCGNVMIVLDVDGFENFA